MTTRLNDAASTTFTVRVDTATKKRLESLAKNTGRSRSFIAAEAINKYLAINDWQIAGIKTAIASVDLDGTILQADIEAWVSSLGSPSELPIPEPTKA
jgi:predicted transcriptional regulator